MLSEDLLLSNPVSNLTDQCWAYEFRTEVMYLTCPWMRASATLWPAARLQFWACLLDSFWEVPVGMPANCLPAVQSSKMPWKLPMVPSFVLWSALALPLHLTDWRKTQRGSGRASKGGLAPLTVAYEPQLVGVWFKGESGGNQKRSLYSGRTALSVHVLLEEFSGWYVSHHTMQPDISRAGCICGFQCTF